MKPHTFMCPKSFSLTAQSMVHYSQATPSLKMVYSGMCSFPRSQDGIADAASRSVCSGEGEGLECNSADPSKHNMS